MAQRVLQRLLGDPEDLRGRVVVQRRGRLAAPASRSAISRPVTRRSTSTCLRSAPASPSASIDAGRSAETTERNSSIAPRASSCARASCAAAASGSRASSEPADSAASVTPKSCWTTESWSSRASRLRSSAIVSSRLRSCRRALSMASAAWAASSTIRRSSASENAIASALSVRYSAPMISPRASIGTPRNERIRGWPRGHQPRKRGSARDVAGPVRRRRLEHRAQQPVLERERAHRGDQLVAHPRRDEAGEAALAVGHPERGVARAAELARDVHEPLQHGLHLALRGQRQYDVGQGVLTGHTRHLTVVR